jgi:hypothetical protein
VTTDAAGSPDGGALADREALVERVAAAVAAHPSVAGPHGGRYNDLATYLATGRLVGVRIGAPGEPVEVGVVLRLDRPIPDVVAELQRAVSALCGGARVDVTVGDVATDADAPRSGAPTGPSGSHAAGVGVAAPPARPDAGRMVR